MADIVRTLPSLIPIPTWLEFEPLIPESNAARSLCFSRQFEIAVKKYKYVPIDIYYNETEDIVTHHEFSNGYITIPRSSFEHVLKVYANYENYVYSLEIENRKLSELYDECNDLIRPTDFVWFRGVKYGNTLENCEQQIKLYNSIKRILPNFSVVTEPNSTLYEVTEKHEYVSNGETICKEYSVTNKYIMKLACHLTKFRDEHEIPNTDELHTIRHQECFIDCKYFIMSGKTLHQICKDHEREISIASNEQILELYNKVFRLTKPSQYIKYNGVRYGHPFIKLE